MEPGEPITIILTVAITALLILAGMTPNADRFSFMFCIACAVLFFLVWLDLRLK